MVRVRVRIGVGVRVTMPEALVGIEEERQVGAHL